MNPRVFHIFRTPDVVQIAEHITRRLKAAGPVNVLVTQLGDEEFALWQRRYRKLTVLLSEHVRLDGGVRQTPTWWSIFLKAQFLIAEEFRLPDGRIHYQLPSTKDMGREARAEFLSDVREFAAERGIALQHPEEQEG